MLVRDSRTSSAKGAFCRHERQDSAGIRLVTVCASALLFFQWRIGFIRRRLRFGALGFAQRGFLVSLSLFLLALSTLLPSLARLDLVRIFA